jgi:molybdopterin molybdotransferase
LRAGTRLRPQDIAMAASLGLGEIPVYARLKAAVFSTGDEVREPGAPLDEGCIYDANRFAILSMLARLGCEVHDLGIFPDDRTTIEDALASAAAGHDLLMTSGGVSKGEEDHVRASVEALGAVNFWNLAIKPGRPIALGHVEAGGAKTPFVGLPGNPVAVLVTFLKIARPIVLLLAGAGLQEPTLFKVAAGFNFEKNPGRREWLRASLARAENGTLSLRKYSEDGSGIISSLVAADGLIELGEELTHVRHGELVDFLPFNEVMS